MYFHAGYSLQQTVECDPRYTQGPIEGPQRSSGDESGAGDHVQLTIQQLGATAMGQQGTVHMYIVCTLNTFVHRVCIHVQYINAEM